MKLKCDICIKFHQKIKKTFKKLNFGLLRFLKGLKNLGFFRSHFLALVSTNWSNFVHPLTSLYVQTALLN